MQLTPLPSIVRARFATLGALCLMVSACGDDPQPSKHDGGMEPVPGPDMCAAADAGTPCGEGQFCVDHQCLPNVCGDGVLAGHEECDDGNQLVGDGCSPSCLLAPLGCGDGVVQLDEECDDGNQYEYDACSTACKLNRCGNGREDGVEECDDGNLINDDACSVTCTENRCGNGRVDVGEECDDGNQVQDDGTWIYQDGTRNNRDTCSNACIQIECGNGRVEGPLLGGQEECDDANENNKDHCSNNCLATGCGNGILEVDLGEVCETAPCRMADGSVCPGNEAKRKCVKCLGWEEDTACKTCRDTYCRAYDDSGGGAVDLVAGCFEKDDASWVQACGDLVTCMRASGTGYNELLGPMESFCGTSNPDTTCQQEGLADGPCIKEWQAATKSTVLATVLGRSSSPARASGWAYKLILCDQASCLSQCGPGAVK
ncbi:MAG: DUF4215 domain-containing protein [Myxococcales bacterium]